MREIVVAADAELHVAGEVAGVAVLVTDPRSQPTRAVTLATTPTAGVLRDLGPPSASWTWIPDEDAEVVERLDAWLADGIEAARERPARASFGALASHRLTLTLTSSRLGEVHLRYTRDDDGLVCDVLWSQKDRRVDLLVATAPGDAPLELIGSAGLSPSVILRASSLVTGSHDEADHRLLERASRELVRLISAGA